MPNFDEIQDWTFGTILSTDNATEFTLNSGEGALFPTPVNGYYLEVFPANTLPLLLPSAASSSKQVEAFRISAGGLSGDTFTWSARNQLGTPTRTILVGDWVCLPLSAEVIAALQTALNPPVVPRLISTSMVVPANTSMNVTQSLEIGASGSLEIGLGGAVEIG